MPKHQLTPPPRIYPEMLPILESVSWDILQTYPPLHAPLTTFRVVAERLGIDKDGVTMGQASVQTREELTQHDSQYSQAAVYLNLDWFHANARASQVYAVLLHELGHVFHLHGGRCIKSAGQAIRSSEEVRASWRAIGVAADMGMDSVVADIKTVIRRAANKKPKGYLVGG